MSRRVLALAALLATPALAADQPPPRIAVAGAGSVFTMPDRVEVDYTVRGEGQTSDDAVRALVATRLRIAAGLATMKAAPDGRVNMITVNAVRGRDCQRYGSPSLSVGECAIVGYTAELQIEVRTPAVRDVGTLIGMISRDGGLDPRIARFYLADDRASMRQAVAAAFADARARAEAVAEGAHVRLTTLLSASDSAGAEPRPEDVMVTGARLEAPPPPPPPPPPPVQVELTPRPIETQARVMVVYAIAP